METAGASLPDALIRFAPASAHGATQTVEHPARVAVEAPAAVQEPGGAVDDLPIDIKLELALGVVADPHRARPRVAFEMPQLPFGQPRLAEHVVEHVELGPGKACGVQQPANVGLRLSSRGARWSVPRRERLTERRSSASMPGRCVRPRRGRVPRRYNGWPTPATTEEFARAFRSRLPREGGPQRELPYCRGGKDTFALHSGFGWSHE